MDLRCRSWWKEATPPGYDPHLLSYEHPVAHRNGCLVLIMAALLTSVPEAWCRGRGTGAGALEHPSVATWALWLC